MEIHILSPEVIDQIAAGEVVERPAHLVKELVENAVDAEATEIEVQIEQGGRWVKVKDNGKGMSRSDLPLAVARHATSKIQKSSDLWQLQSYGFRGEALATISAVSRMTIISKSKASEGFQMVTEFGKSSDLQQVGAEKGTTILVENLFANVPARLKFLKSDTAEVTQIKNVLKALALCYPKVSFRVRANNKLAYFWPQAESLKERAEQVLERAPMYTGAAEVEGVRAEVCVCPPNVTTGNGRQIWLFAQKRWVQDRSLQAAVMDGYRSLLMHGEFPIAVAWVDCDPEEIDVNIHPTKSQVKFLKANNAFRAVNRAVRSVLEQAPWVKDAIGSSTSSSVDYRIRASVASSEPMHSADTELKETLQFQDASFKQTMYAKKQFAKPDANTSMMDTLNNYSSNPTVRYKDNNELDHYLANESIGDETVISSAIEVADSTSSVEDSEKLGHWSALEILGQAHLTYIVTQNEKSLILVDQHAAHERVAYESLMAAWKGGRVEVQNFLVPFAIDLEAEQVEAIVQQQEEIAKLGVSVEQMGPETIAVNAAPIILKEKALLHALKKLADEIVDKGGSFALEKVIGDICATLACHSVVRAGQSLSVEQMRSLLQQMDEFPMSSFCPHGRPVYVEYPFYKVEKDFGRIV